MLRTPGHAPHRRRIDRTAPPAVPVAPKRGVATIAEALARPESERVELIRGTLVQKAAPTGEHGTAQTRIITGVTLRFDRRPGGRWPGGWWIETEVDMVLGKELFRPDIAGWRREHATARP